VLCGDVRGQPCDDLRHHLRRLTHRAMESIAKVWSTPIEQLGKALITLLLASWADDVIEPVASMPDDVAIGASPGAMTAVLTLFKA
jgi:hypothetical protein